MNNSNKLGEILTAQGVVGDPGDEACVYGPLLSPRSPTTAGAGATFNDGDEPAQLADSPRPGDGAR
jgi:hypothetical protein